MVFYKTYKSPVGLLYISADNENLLGLWSEKDRHYSEYFEEPMELLKESDSPVGEILNRTCEWLDRYFRGEEPDPGELPLKPEGSEFRQLVWDELLKIPYGELTTYGTIAKTIAARCGKKKMSAQAIGGAVGHNPISIIIPCHRVIGASGKLTGYGGGLDMKISLLKIEGIDTGILTE